MILQFQHVQGCTGAVGRGDHFGLEPWAELVGRVEPAGAEPRPMAGTQQEQRPGLERPVDQDGPRGVGRGRSVPGEVPGAEPREGLPLAGIADVQVSELGVEEHEVAGHAGLEGGCEAFGRFRLGHQPQHARP